MDKKLNHTVDAKYAKLPVLIWQNTPEKSYLKKRKSSSLYKDGF
jgi:hypothetical protein